jgi:hypothetical protein
MAVCVVHNCTITLYSAFTVFLRTLVIFLARSELQGLIPEL